MVNRGLNRDSVTGALNDIFATLKSRLEQTLPVAVTDRVISIFREGFIFTKLRTCEVSRK